jgi:hypothetical protein
LLASSFFPTNKPDAVRIERFSNYFHFSHHLTM